MSADGPSDSAKSELQPGPNGDEESWEAKASKANGKWHNKHAAEAAIGTLNALSRVAGAVPVPGLAAIPIVAAEILRAVDDSKENRKSFGRLADEAYSMARVVVEGCKAETEKGLCSEDQIQAMKHHVDTLHEISLEIRDFAIARINLPSHQRWWKSKKDSGKPKEFREKLNGAIQRFQVQCIIASRGATNRIESQLADFLIARQAERDAIPESSVSSSPGLGAGDIVNMAPQVVVTSPEPQLVASQIQSPSPGPLPPDQGVDIAASTPPVARASSTSESGLSNPRTDVDNLSCLPNPTPTGERGPSPSPSSTTTIAGVRDPPQAYPTAASSPTSQPDRNPFRSARPVSSEPSPPPSVNHANSPNPFNLPTRPSPRPDPAASLGSFSILGNSPNASIGGNASVNYVTGTQNNSSNNNTTNNSNVGNVYGSTNVGWNPHNQYAYGPDPRVYSGSPHGYHHSHYAPPPPPPHPYQYQYPHGWSPPPPQGPYYRGPAY
ncbi:hypothetical protein V5O48_006741 [Marasmius crinis-equi]|uniref:Uncharacterized protein n=1 Tax=Marasmius crinis-equi TaxID=585013 RepID=A0ABR3FIP1_9AGAR